MQPMPGLRLLLFTALALSAAHGQRPRIIKLGTIDVDLVEATPVVFHGRLYRFEYVRQNYWANKTGNDYFRFVDHETGQYTPGFAQGRVLGSAFVDGDTVYVTGTGGHGKKWGAGQVRIYASRDLRKWQEWVALDLPGFSIFNTSMCKAGDRYVLMFEIDKPADQAGVPFTARFATSRDLRKWDLTPPECNYSKDRYTAPHCLRYLDGYFYDFYLEAHDGYEMRVVRSKDLIHWQSSPLNPVLRASEEDRKIANPKLLPAHRQRIAAAVDRNNSDIDFCEFQGRLNITYSWGNQQGVEHLAEATFEGTESDFLKAWFPAPSQSSSTASSTIEIGSRLELLADSALIERLTRDARRQLHQPAPREVAISMDKPWEGNAVNYVTVFQDGKLYRMYYRGADVVYTSGGSHESHREVTCYAESTDGIHWTKPDLGLFEFNGSKQNNIVWDGLGRHNFTPFRDSNPACPAEAGYKALGYGESPAGKGLYAFRSPDGIHWSMMSEAPVITRGAFDSQNLAFWDSHRGEYREYHRDFREGRDIRTATSKDFVTWSDPVFLEYSPGRVSELYTNQVIPYYRAPHIFLGFPTRYTDRGWTKAAESLPRLEYRRLRAAKSRREGTAVTDGMFMVSRDGLHFEIWPESFLRPGLRATDSWFYGDTYQNWGLVETRSALADAPPEISVYVTESTMQERMAYLRRYTIRPDGFVSIAAPLSGGELLTRPLRFQGRRLLLNYSTSAAGSIRVELQDANGRALPGFTLADSQELYGDSLAQAVEWKNGADVSALAGKPVRLRLELRDADLFSLRFVE